MVWPRVLRFVLDAKGFDDKIAKIKTPFETAKKTSKIKPANLSVDDLKPFDSKTLTPALAGARQLLEAAKTAEKVKLELPASDTRKIYVEWMGAARKHGIKDPQASKARLKYLAALRVHNGKMKVELKRLNEITPKLERNLKLVKSMVGMGDFLGKGFAVWAKAPKAEAGQLMTGLSKQATQYRGTVGELGKSMTQLQKKNTGFAKEISETMKVNQLWIKNVLSDSFATEESLKKNLKAVKPKK